MITAANRVVRAAAVSASAPARALAPASVGALAETAPASAPVGAVAEAAPTPAPTKLLAKLDASVQHEFQSLEDLLAALPASNIITNLEGALLAVRRSLFDQGPTASPVQQTTTSAGQILGTLGALDPVGDPLTYTVLTQPTSGTVAVSADGQYTYTPGQNFTGSDSFSVQVATAKPVVDLLNPSSHGSTQVTVQVGAHGPTNPFTGANDHTALYLPDASADVTVAKKNGRLLGTVTLTGVTPDTQMTWMDQLGRLGHVSLGDLTGQWGGFQSEGDVTMGLDYTLEDGTEATLLLKSVKATANASGQYVLSGVLEPTYANLPAGFKTVYNVIGTEYQSSYENFLGTLTNNSTSQTVTGANLFLDTYDLYTYEEELAGAGNTPAQAPLQAGASVLPAPPSLSQNTLKSAVTYAQNGGSAVTSTDPLFGPNGQFKPGCAANNTCAADGIYVKVNASQAPTSLASANVAVGDQQQPVSLSYDLGAATYGYLYVPGGIWDKLNPSKYSFAALLSLTTGPSMTLTPVNGQGTISYARQLGFQDTLQTPIGALTLGGNVDANLAVTLGSDSTPASGQLTGNVYITGGVVIACNTTAGPGFQVAGNYYLDTNSSAPNQITAVAINGSLIPSLTGSMDFSTPPSTPWIGQQSLLYVALGYTNPISMNLQLPSGGSPSLTAQASGTLSVKASVLPVLTGNTLAFQQAFPLYNVTTSNLLA
jgi:hypothetical protein